MQTRKQMLPIPLFLCIFFLVEGLGIAEMKAHPQTPAKTQSEPKKEPTTGKVVIEGRIDYMKNLGGYFVRGTKPKREYFIVNQDPDVLEGLKKAGQNLKIEARRGKGAEYLIIEKIDGKPYKAEKQAPQDAPKEGMKKQ